MSDQHDNPLKGDKRTDETMMISSDNLSDIVDQAKGATTPATPPAQPAPAAVVVLVVAVALVVVLAG